MKIMITILLAAAVAPVSRIVCILQSYLGLRRWRRQMLHARRDQSRG